jgi:hypothetical protein
MTAHALVFPRGSRRDSRRSRGPVTAEDRELSRPDWRLESPLLLTRAQAAQLCQVSEKILDQRSYEPSFPVIRRNGGHFVRIHRAALERGSSNSRLGRAHARHAATRPAVRCPPPRPAVMLVRRRAAPIDG